MDVNETQIRAALGFEDAQLALGLRYYAGTGVPRDRERGIRLLKRAADQGNASALLTLAQAEQAEQLEAANYARAWASCAPTPSKASQSPRAAKAGKSNAGCDAQEQKTDRMEWAPYTYAGAASLRSSSITWAPHATAARRRLLHAERHALSLRFEHRCAECRVLLPVGWHADHIVPLADGGPDDASNMQPMCQPCHTLKTALENSSRRPARRQGS